MRWWVVAVVIALVALVVYLATSTPAPEVASSSETATSPTARDASNELARVASEAQRAAAVTDAPAAAAEPGELVIEVVDARTQEAVPGAQVFVEREEVDELERDVAEERLGFGGPALAKALGRELVADDAGLARVASPRRERTIWASLAERCGEVQVAAGATHARVELVVERSAIVEVVGPDGRPAAGVAVGVFEYVLSEWSVCELVQTDEHGRAELHGLEELGIRRDAPLKIATTLVGCTPVAVDIDPAHPPAAPVRLEIAESGTVELTATDAQGAPLAIAARFLLRLDDRSAAALPFGMAAREPLFVSTRDGRARVGHVGLDLALRADAQAEGLRFTERFFRGPSEVDALVALGVPVREAQASIRARLVWPDGAPIAGRRVRAEFLSMYGFRHGHDEELVTTADGAVLLYWHIPESKPPAYGEVSLDVATPGASSARGTALLPAAHRLLDVVPRDEYDLGEVVCSTDPPFCTGRVVDAIGRPVAAARVAFHWQGADGERASGPIAIANERGEFQVGAPAGVAEVQIAAMRPDANRWPPTRDVVRGARDVVLALEPEQTWCTVRGRWIGEEGLIQSDLDLWLEPVGGGARTSPPAETSDAGGYELQVMTAGAWWLIVTFEDVEVGREGPFETRLGGTVELPPIDLRPSVHVLTFTVLDEHGAPLGGGNVAEIRGEDYVNHVQVSTDGTARLPAIAPTIDVVASAPGKRSQIFRGVRNGARLPVAAGTTAIVRAPPLGSAGAELALAIELSYCGDDPAQVFSDDVAFVVAEGDRAEIAVPAAGVYCVRGALLVHRASGARFPLRFADPPLVTLVEAPAESALSLPADALGTALDAATRR